MKARPSKVEKDIAHKLYRDQKRCDEYHKLGRSQSTSVERVKVCSECFFVLWLQFKEETSAHDCYSGGAWNLSQAITQHMRPGWVQGAQLLCNVKLTWRGPNKMRCSCTFDIPRTEQDMALQVQSNVCSIQVGKRSFSGGKERREGGLTPA